MWWEVILLSSNLEFIQGLFSQKKRPWIQSRRLGKYVIRPRSVCSSLDLIWLEININYVHHISSWDLLHFSFAYMLCSLDTLQLCATRPNLLVVQRSRVFCLLKMEQRAIKRAHKTFLTTWSRSACHLPKINRTTAFVPASIPEILASWRQARLRRSQTSQDGCFEKSTLSYECEDAEDDDDDDLA